jgi:transcriptional regulator with XRE-family HTH domain
MIEKHKRIYKRIGTNIKEHRKRAGLTQEELASKGKKLDRSKISDMENGKEDFMFSTLLEVADGLDTDVENLTKEQDEEI